MTSRTDVSPLEREWGEDAALVASDWLATARLSWPCTVTSSSTGLASLQPATRSDTGEAVWLLTEKAMAYLSHSRAPLCQKASLGPLCLGRGTERCAGDGRTSP